MPLHSGEHLSAIGDKGELWLASRLPQGWIWQPPRKDVGKDGLIVIRDDSDLHNLEFSIQVKTTSKLRNSRGFLIIPNVSRSSVLYWMASAHPTLIVAVDIAHECAWYAWHFYLFKSVGDLPEKSKKSITIRIPIKNELTDDAWDDIRSELKRCYNYLYNSLSKGDSYVWIVSSTSSICNAARNLIKISESPVPGPEISEDEGITVLIEEQQHRNILIIAHKLLKGLSLDSKLRKDVSAWLTVYEHLVREAFPKLGHCLREFSINLDRSCGLAPMHCPRPAED